ncbi:MAG: lysine--tRNA ligase [Polyangiales bacterium]
MASEEELKGVRRAKIEKLKEHGSAGFPNRLRATQDDLAARRASFVRHALEAKRAKDADAVADIPSEDQLAPDAAHVPLFGRVVAKRGPFVVIRTPDGDAQALVRPENLPEADRESLALIDLADHVHVEGPVIKTRTLELAVLAKRYQHVGKALLPPPEKWKGLTDVEKRYRERYVDLFANPDVARIFRARSTLVKTIRGFLDERDFLEVETPLLHQVRGGATAKPFTTHHNALDLSLYLRIAPELYLKRLLVGGFDRVYEIGRCFRNEGISTRHNPEFTLLEFYMAYATVDDLLDLAEPMLRAVDEAVRSDLVRHGAEDPAAARPFDLEAPFARVTLRQSILDRLERSRQGTLPPTPWADLVDREALYDSPAKLDVAFQAMIGKADPVLRKQLAAHRNHGERLFLLYELLAEPHLVDLYRTADGSKSVPVFITEYPFEVSPLARKNDQDPDFVDRFELFIDGREVANAFSELNDPDDQAARFRAQLERRDVGDEEAMDFDADYIRALEHGMPPAAGFGLGIDRMVMLLCHQPSIRDVLLFPLLRPEGG